MSRVDRAESVLEGSAVDDSGRSLRSIAHSLCVLARWAERDMQRQDEITERVKRGIDMGVLP